MQDLKQEGSGTQQTTTYVRVEEAKSNTVGIVGFVFSIFGLIFGWIPFIGWILWLTGAICSIIGLFKNPKGLAIAGTVISFIGVIILLGVLGALMSF